MVGDKIKQQARMSILEKLKQKGAPISPFPGEKPMIDAELSGEQETLNDFGLEPDLGARLKKKNRPIISEDEI